MKNAILPEKWVIYMRTCKWHFWEKKIQQVSLIAYQIQK